MAACTVEKATFDQQKIELTSLKSSENTYVLPTSVKNAFYLHPPGVFITALCLALHKSAVEYCIRGIRASVRN